MAAALGGDGIGYNPRPFHPRLKVTFISRGFFLAPGIGDATPSCAGLLAATENPYPQHLSKAFSFLVICSRLNAICSGRPIKSP